MITWLELLAIGYVGGALAVFTCLLNEADDQAGEDYGFTALVAIAWPLVAVHGIWIAVRLERRRQARKCKSKKSS